MQGNTCDKILKEFKVLCLTESAQSGMKNYYHKSKRLDHFWRELLTTSNSSDDLLNFIKKVLIFSHGNASVERGFSVNKETIVDNFLNKTLVGQRLVYDSIKCAGGFSNI